MSKNTHDHFAVRQVPKRLKGIDAKLISELFDLTLCYGRDFSTADGNRILSASTDPPLYVTVHSSGERRHVFVSTTRNSVAVTAEDMVVFGPEPGNSVLVVDGALSLSDLHALVLALNEEYKDFRDPVTGARLRIASDRTADANMCVDELLRDHPNGVTFPAGTTPGLVASRLDRPKDVVFLKDADAPCGFRMVLRSRLYQQPDVERAVVELMEEFGITSTEQLDKLPATEKTRFADRLNARFACTVDDEKKKE